MTVYLKNEICEFEPLKIINYSIKKKLYQHHYSK